MASLIGTILAERRTQTLEKLDYHILPTLVPLPGYLDDQQGEFLEL